MADGVQGVFELQQRERQLAVQEAQLSLQQQQARQAAEELQFSQDLGVINADWVSPEDKLNIINTRIGPRLKLLGPVTMEGIAPFRSLMNELTKRHQKGLPIDDLQGQIDYFSANPKFVAPQEMPTLVKAQEQLREGKINQLVPQPATPDPVKESRQRLNEFGPLLQVSDQNEWADAYNAEHVEGLDEETYQRARRLYPSRSVLIDQLRRDQAAHEANLMQKQEVDRTRQLFRANPSLIDKALEGKVEQLGYGSDPAKAITMRAFQIMQKPYDEQTDPEKRYVAAWAGTIATGPQAEQHGFLTARKEADLANQDMKDSQGRRTVLEQGLVVDGKAQEAVRDLNEMRVTVLKGIEGKTKATDEEIKNTTGKAAEYATLTQAGLQAYEQATAGQVQYYQEVTKQAQQKLVALQRRLSTAPIGQSEMLSKQVQDTTQQVAASEASKRLLTEHNPYEIELLQGQRVQYQLQGDTESMKKVDDLIAQKQAGRQKDLSTVQSYRLHLIEREKTAGQRLTNLDYKVKKEEALRMASQYVLGQRKAGVSWTKAVQDAATSFAVQPKDLVEQVDFWRKNEGETTLTQAQTDLGMMADAWVAKNGDWPDHTAMMKMATTLMKNPRYAGLKREEIVKGMERGSRLEIALPTQVKQHSIEDIQNLGLAQQTIDDLRDIVEKNPTAVGAVGGVQRFFAGMGQQVHDVARAAFAQDKNLDPKAKQRLQQMLDTKPADELEALTIGLTYRVARAVSGPGVLANQDVEFAERMVGGLKSASGSVQFMNKLGIIEREMRRRARSARSLLETKGRPQGEAAPANKPLSEMTIEELMRELQPPGS